jgi:hypothetical protein
MEIHGKGHEELNEEEMSASEEVILQLQNIRDTPSYR